MVIDTGGDRMRAGWLLSFAFVVAADATSQTSIGVITGIVRDHENNNDLRR
jgi:hypothetical protein